MGMEKEKKVQQTLSHATYACPLTFHTSFMPPNSIGSSVTRVCPRPVSPQRPTQPVQTHLPNRNRSQYRVEHLPPTGTCRSKTQNTCETELPSAPSPSHPSRKTWPSPCRTGSGLVWPVGWMLNGSGRDTSTNALVSSAPSAPIRIHTHVSYMSAMLGIGYGLGCLGLFHNRTITATTQYAWRGGWNAGDGALRDGHRHVSLPSADVSRSDRHHATECNHTTFSGRGIHRQSRCSRPPLCNRTQLVVRFLSRIVLSR